jgi:hypothetical protein
MTKKSIPHAHKLTAVAACAFLAACGGGGGGDGGGGSEGRFQAISFSYPGGNTLLNGPTTLSATATSGLPVSFRTGTPTTCTVADNQVTLVAAGECLVIASQSGGVGSDGTKWAAADDTSQLFVVLKHEQRPVVPVGLVLRAAAPVSLTLSDKTDGGNPATYTSTTPSVCTVSGTTLNVLGEGFCALGVTAPENASYAAMTKGQAFIQIGTMPPSVVPLQGATQTVALGSVDANGNALTYASTTPTVCTVVGHELRLNAKGGCAVTLSSAAGTSENLQVVVDPLLVSSGFMPGSSVGWTESLKTWQGGRVTTNPWSSTLGAGWERCNPTTDDGVSTENWCYSKVSDDGLSLVSALHLPDSRWTPGNWQYGFNRVEIFSPNLFAFDSAGDTKGGLKLASEKTLNFTLGVNTDLYSAGKPIVVHLDLAKRNNDCNVTLSTLVWVPKSGMVSYAVPLSNFAVTAACGLSGVTEASLDNEVRKLPNPYDSTGAPVNDAAFQAALDKIAASRTSAATLLQSSSVVRTRFWLMDINENNKTGGITASDLTVNGLIYFQ